MYSDHYVSGLFLKDNATENLTGNLGWRVLNAFSNSLATAAAGQPWCLIPSVDTGSKFQ